MQNHFCVTFLFASVFLENGLCNKNVVKDTDNQESREQISYSNNYLGRVSETNPRKYNGGTRISNFAGPLRAIIEEALYDQKTGQQYQGKGIFESKGYEFAIDAGNPDLYGEIKRPCQAYDTFCIRKFFAEHSNCKISGGVVPDPLFRAQDSGDYGTTNMTQLQLHGNYRGLNNARITEFYINEVTDNLVMAITFGSAQRNSSDTFFKFYLRGREPVVTRDFGAIQYGALTITVIIPQLHNLTLERSKVHTYADDNKFSFVVGPGIGTTTDPEVLSMIAAFYANVPTLYLEEIASKGPFILGNFIQYYICDFGLKVL